MTLDEMLKSRDAYAALGDKTVGMPASRLLALLAVCEAARRVAEISARKHDAWDALSAAFEALEEMP